MKFFGRIAYLALLSCPFVFAQTPGPVSCTPGGVPVILRSEGLAERLGDLVINCTGGVPGTMISGNLVVFLPVSDTNKLSGSGTLDAILTLDTGAGPVSAGVSAVQQGASAVAFNGVSFTLSSFGSAVLRVTNLRGAVTQLGLDGNRPVQVALGFNGPNNISLTNSLVTVGVTQRGLLAGASSTRVTCTGSQLPSTLGMADLFASGSRFVTTRFTEGFAAAFEPRQPLADSGSRVIIHYTGFPANARLVVPDVIAGSDAATPTAGGDLGSGPSGGAYTAGSSTLVLARVLNADSTGAGGTPFAQLPAAGTVQFDSASDVPLTKGAGYAVYEVLNANPNSLESAQFPTFLGLPPITDGSTPVTAVMDIMFAPVSTIAAASASAPVPRFVAAAPPQDCTALGDCNASYFPRLQVQAARPLQFTALSGSAFQVAYVQLTNGGGGVMNWTAAITYQTGTGWATASPDSGNTNSTVRIDVHPEKLPTGTYQATLTLDAGPVAGARTLPITLTVTQLPPVVTPPPVPQISAVGNAASFSTSAVVAGSLATLTGLQLTGKSVTVTFDAFVAPIFFQSDKQINLLVPAQLGTRTSAQVVVTADGLASAPMLVKLAPTAAAIFGNGVLNQDNSVNTASNPAQVGTILQVFAAGLAMPDGWQITAQVHDRPFAVPYYGGPAPSVPGVQQVDVVIPADLPAMTTFVRVCASLIADPSQRVCSDGYPITIRQ